MKQQLLVALTVLATGATLVFPKRAKAQTLIEELQQRSNGTTVLGEIISVVGNDFLDNGTGQIIVDAGPQRWQDDLTPGEVTGELGRGGDGSIGEIRSSDGPPPWAGGANRNQKR